jgi:hypothetical protein
VILQSALRQDLETPPEQRIVQQRVRSIKTREQARQYLAEVQNLNSSQLVQAELTRARAPDSLVWPVPKSPHRVRARRARLLTALLVAFSAGLQHRFSGYLNQSTMGNGLAVSVLDLVGMRAGESAGSAIARSVDLAQHGEQ